MTKVAPQNARQYFLNLALVLGLGVAASWWVWRYTEHIELIGGLLGLGGVFAWIAFIANLVGEGRKAQLQEWLDAVMQRSCTTWVVLALAVVFLLALPLRTGALLLDSGPDEKDRSVRITPADGGDPVVDAEPLAPRAQGKFLLAAGWWWIGGGSKRYSIKLSGLPAIDVTVGILERVRLVAPRSFRRAPLLLVHPTLSDTSYLQKDPGSAIVLIGGKELARIEAYRGEAFWVGAGEDMPIPAEIRARWSKDKEANWLPQRGVADGLDLRQQGGEIVIKILGALTNTDGTVVKDGRVISEKSLKDSIPLQDGLIEEIGLD